MTDTAATGSTPFIALDDHDVPSLPTQDRLQLLKTRLRELLKREPDSPLVTDDRLRRSTLDRLDNIVAPPACGPLIDELQVSLADWIADAEPRVATRLVVMPPGDRSQVISSWAEQYGHEMLAAPPRSALAGAKAIDLPDLDGERLLVIPALEDWFLRHRNGLATVRRLLEALAALDRHVLVGCNSWAWQYLVRAVDADAVLSAPLIFTAFDAERLHQWFSEISRDPSTSGLRFRDARSGEDVLARDEDDEPHDALVSLAARARGIPWVAWHLWRRSLRTRIEQEEEEAAEAATGTPAALEDDEDTLWVVALDEFSLPGRADAETLLILHALLIHGPLTTTTLAAVLPRPESVRRLPSLIAPGLVERYPDNTLGCAPAAYPAIRSGLETAGFPIPSV